MKKTLIRSLITACAAIAVIGGTVYAQTQDQLSSEQADAILKQRLEQERINKEQQQRAPQATVVQPPAGAHTGILPNINGAATQTAPQPITVVSGKTTMPNAGPAWNGVALSKANPTVQGPSGNESATSEDIQALLDKAKAQGIEGEYHEDENGIKYYGDKIIVFANQKLNGRHFGDIIDTTNGEGIVLGDAGFGTKDPTQVIIAVNW